MSPFLRYEVEVEVHFLIFGGPVVLAHSVEKTILPPLNRFCNCVKTQLTILVCVYFGVLFCFICVSIPPLTQAVSIISSYIVSPPTFFFQIILAILVPLPFPISFRISFFFFLTNQKILLGFW